MPTPKVFETSPGKFSLTMDADDVNGVVEASGHTPNGYFWEGVAQILVATRAPELAERFDYDPEGGMFCAFGADRAALDALCALMQAVVTNASALEQLIANADDDAFDD